MRLQSGLAARYSSARMQGLCAKHPRRCRGSQRDKSSLLQEYFRPCLEKRLFIFQTMEAKSSIPLPDQIFPNPKFRICGPVIDIPRGLQQENVKMSIPQKIQDISWLPPFLRRDIKERKAKCGKIPDEFDYLSSVLFLTLLPFPSLSLVLCL